MSTRTLLGRDWDNDWDTTPVTGDTALIQAGVDQNIDTGATQTGVDLAELRTHSGFKRNVASSGTPLRIAATLVRHHGSGDFFYSSDGDAGSALVTDEMLIWPAARGGGTRAVCEINCVNSGTLGRVFAGSGIVRLLSLVDWATTGALHVGMNNSPSDVEIDLATMVDALPLLNMGAGTGRSQAVITTAIVAGAGTKLTQIASTITTLYIMGGAEVQYEAAALTTVYVGPGSRLDLITGDTKVKTVTNIDAAPSSIVDYDASLHTLTNFRDHRRKLA